MPLLTCGLRGLPGNHGSHVPKNDPAAGEFHAFGRQYVDAQETGDFRRIAGPSNGNVPPSGRIEHRRVEENVFVDRVAQGHPQTRRAAVVENVERHPDRMRGEWNIRHRVCRSFARRERIAQRQTTPARWIAAQRAVAAVRNRHEVRVVGKRQRDLVRPHRHQRSGYAFADANRDRRITRAGTVDASCVDVSVLRLPRQQRGQREMISAWIDRPHAQRYRSAFFDVGIGRNDRRSRRRSQNFDADVSAKPAAAQDDVSRTRL